MTWILVLLINGHTTSGQIFARVSFRDCMSQASMIDWGAPKSQDAVCINTVTGAIAHEGRTR